VDRLILATARQIVANALDHLQAKLSLPGHVVVFAYGRVVNGVEIGEDLGHEGHQFGAQLVEQALNLGGLHVRLVLVEQRVVHALLVAERLSFLAFEVKDALQHRRECRKVGLGARLSPHFVRLRRDAGYLSDQRRRHARGQVVVALDDAHQRRLVAVVVQAVHLDSGSFNQLSGFLSGELLMSQAAERGKLLGAGWRAAGRHVHLLIPA